MKKGLRKFYCTLPNGKVQEAELTWKTTHAVACRTGERDWYAHSWCSAKSAALRCVELTQKEQGAEVEILVVKEVPPAA